eukprot:3185324-Rhodomonas_salina.2
MSAKDKDAVAVWAEGACGGSRRAGRGRQRILRAREGLAVGMKFGKGGGGDCKRGSSRVL